MNPSFSQIQQLVKRLKLYILPYKAILGLLSSYLLSYTNQSNARTYNLRSQDLPLLSVPKVRTELGRTVLRFDAPSAWIMLQKTLKQNELVSLNTWDRGNLMSWKQKHLAVDVLPEALLFSADLESVLMFVSTLCVCKNILLPVLARTLL